MKSLHLLLATLFLTFTLPSLAQQNPDNGGEEEPNTTETDGPRRFWQANLPTGHYMVALDRISTISMHEYLLDGGLVITEVTVDTLGRALARFYHIAPLSDTAGRDEVSRVVDRGRELLDRAGQKAGTDAHNMAQKNYPTTTHAGTVEYRIVDKRDLGSLYGSLKKSWESGKGRKLTIK